MLEEYFDEEHPAFLSYFNNYGYLHKLDGNLEEAREYTERAFAGYVQAYGDNHMSTINCMANLGSIYKDLNMLNEAIEKLERCLEMLQMFGTESEKT